MKNKNPAGNAAALAAHSVDAAAPATGHAAAKRRRIQSYLVAIAAASFGLAVVSAQAANLPEDLQLIQKGILDGRDNFDDEEEWREAAVELPPAPQAANLVPIEISQLTSNRFAVDLTSVEYGDDGVIRYTIVITSPSGVQNVAYEGIRCATAERRTYAFGKADGTWRQARSSKWLRIEDNNMNRHHAALFKDYFCTTGGTVLDTKGARDALQNGNPALHMWQ